MWLIKKYVLLFLGRFVKLSMVKTNPAWKCVVLYTNSLSFLSYNLRGSEDAFVKQVLLLILIFLQCRRCVFDKTL